MFLTEHDLQLASNVADNFWLAKLAYLSDIFNHLNALNVSLQAKDSNVLRTTDQIVAFKKKLSIWTRLIEEKFTDAFEQAQRCFGQIKQPCLEHR